MNVSDSNGTGGKRTRPVQISLRRNLKWGVRWGLTVALGFTVIGLIATIAAAFDPRPSTGPSFLSLVGFYFLAGTCGGLVIGLLRPITAYKAGAIFVATLVVAVSLSLLDYLYVIEDHWKLVDTILIAFGSLVGGPVAALMIWEGRSRLGKRPSDARDPEDR